MGQVVAEVFDHRQRVRVGPVQVLEHHNHPARVSQPPQELDHRLPPDRGRSLAMALALQRRDDRRERRQPGHKARVVRERAAAQRLQHRLGQRPVGAARRGGYPPACHHCRAEVPGAGRHLARQPRLADTRLTGQEHHTALASACGGQGCTQRAQLRVAPDHHRAQHISHVGSLPQGPRTDQQRQLPVPDADQRLSRPGRHARDT